MSGIDRRRFIGNTLAFAAATAAVSCGSTSGAPAAPRHRTLVRGAQVFDGDRVRSGTDVLIVGDTLAEPDGAPVDTVVDGTGKTLLPGLIDAHTHVFEGGLAQALTFGVTTELDMFCPPTVLPAQRHLAATRDDVADLRSAGTLATATGGHPTQLIALMGAAGILPAGAEGPPPHFHTGSAELFFVLAGTLRVLAGDEIVDLAAHDFLLIPPYMPARVGGDRGRPRAAHQSAAGARRTGGGRAFREYRPAGAGRCPGAPAYRQRRPGGGRIQRWIAPGGDRAGHRRRSNRHRDLLGHQPGQTRLHCVS